MVRTRCIATRGNGEPCQAFALPDEALCFSHHPDKAAEVKAAQRRGGANRANYRRAARQWAAAGEVIAQDDLPAFLRAAIIDVREGRLEPAVASAIAGLAKTAVAIKADMEMDARLQRLEERAGIAAPKPLHRVK